MFRRLPPFWHCAFHTHGDLIKQPALVEKVMTAREAREIDQRKGGGFVDASSVRDSQIGFKPDQASAAFPSLIGGSGRSPHGAASTANLLVPGGVHAWAA